MKGRILSKAEFEEAHTFHLNKATWPEYFWRFKRVSERARGKIRSGQMAYAHQKDAHSKWSDLVRRPMRDFFFPPPDAPRADAQFIEEIKQGAMDRVRIKSEDKALFIKYANHQIDKQVGLGDKNTIEDFVQIMAMFDLEFDEVCKMNFVEFFEWESYLKSVYKLSKKFQFQRAVAFRIEMKKFNFNTPAGFSIHWQSYMHRMRTPDTIKPNDANDLYYLMFFPYVNIFTCDNSMKDTLGRVFRTMEPPNGGTKIMNATEFKVEIGI